MDCLVDFLVANFESCIWLAIILVAMCPMLESKIAIPLAMNSSIWGVGALSGLSAFLLSFLGSIIPSYIILMISKKIKKKTTGFVSSKLFHKYTIKGSSIERKSSELKKYLTLAGFVALPIPLTGVWTGSLIAGFTNLNLNYSFFAISLGSAISAGVITLLCTIFTNSISYIFMSSLLIVIIFMFIDLFSSMCKHKIN